jgi:hypothetical protein
VTVYRCANLLVRSPLELAAPVADGPPDAEPDVEIVEGEARPVPYERPSVEVIAERTDQKAAWYTFARGQDGVVGRFYGSADFEITAGADGHGRRVTFHPGPGTPQELVAILTAGTVVAYLLSDEGQLVLHASAVDADGTALAFIGQSGQGKTTMATLMCAEGYPLVADDLLPVEVTGNEVTGNEVTGNEVTGNEVTGNEVTCLPVGSELRVREKMEALLERFDARVKRRRTVDERYALAVPATSAERLPLGAVVLPWPDRETGEVSSRRLSAGEAIVTLARCQRVEGWRSARILKAQFAAISALVGSVPVFEVHVPWGPPFREVLAKEVLLAVGWPFK